MSELTLLIVEAPGREFSRASCLTRRAGFKVQQTNCGNRVSTTACRLQPDLVLISPQPSGARLSEIARAIKENPATSDIPVVVLTEGDPVGFLSGSYPTEACLSVGASDQELMKTLRLLTAGTRHRRRRPARAGPLEGNLEEDVFPELLHYLFATRKSGRVTVICGAHRGTIHLEDGNVVDAELGDARGVGAFKRLCFLTPGRFRFEPQRTSPQPTMCVRGIDLLLEAACEKDERGRQRAPEGERAVGRLREGGTIKETRQPAGTGHVVRGMVGMTAGPSRRSSAP